MDKIIAYILFFIIALFIIFAYVIINNYFESQCINNNSTAIYNEFGRFERCVRR